MKIFCFDPQKRKNVYAGEYNPTNYTFSKQVNQNHFMILEKGYGIQEEVLQQLSELGCKNIVIKTLKGIQVSLLADWFKQPVKNYGHGRQRFLGRS
jgi:hypothetical protein